jgi:putative oxygen-independent coproporphyrinogen III oxidase
VTVPNGSEPFGVYIHVPFCAKRCDYCAFATWTDRDHLRQHYVDALVADIARSSRSGLPSATSVFVGGGTPSLLSGPQMAAILSEVEVSVDAEVTIECNPDTVSAELFEAYRNAGVNRLSFGVQSMVDRVLLGLGRTHTKHGVERAVELAKQAGFSSINLDLIYGGAGETIDDWKSTLDAVVAMNVAHISAYALTIEAGTPLAADPDRHPDDDDQAEKYEIASEVLGQSGYENYEISNWSLAGYSCRHNRLYWSQGNYVGFGCAAHSHQRNADGSSRRWWNARTPERYIELVGLDRPTETAGEDLDPSVVALERLQLNLRMSTGVEKSAFRRDDLEEFFELGLLDDAGVAEDGESLVRLTMKGRLLANAVSVRLVGDSDTVEEGTSVTLP